MKQTQHGRFWPLLILLLLPMLACGLFDSIGPEIPRNAAVVNVVANTSLQPWLETAVPAFNDSKAKNSDGDPVYVVVEYVEAGQAVTNMASGADTALWLPEEPVWANVLADQGNATFQGDCVSVAQSPLVIGLWRDVADALGYPGLPLGWLDVGSLAADPSAWNYYSGGELGDAFRLGHTHPGLSGSGVSTLLAIVQAAQGKSDAVTTAEIQRPIVQASVGAFEGGVATFATSTAALAQTMRDRGVTYLTAGIMYESTAVYYGQGNIIPVYPLEGTFMATHPACLNQAANGIIQESARLFRDYLLSVAGQETAVSVGLRPVNDAVTITAPLSAENGVALSQPQTIFNAPSVETIYSVQELWQAARKDVNLVMLLDTSGSMRGGKMESMRAAAMQFVQQMGDEDTISIIAFETEPVLLVEYTQVGPARAEIIATIDRLRAAGDTTLYDAIGDGAALIAATHSINMTNAMVILTDGQDTRSYRYRFDDALIKAATAHDTTVFTIAYGSDADERVLAALAARGNGNFYQGDEASIAAIYEEMSAAFGGSVGVGR